MCLVVINGRIGLFAIYDKIYLLSCYHINVRICLFVIFEKIMFMLSMKEYVYLLAMIIHV